MSLRNKIVKGQAITCSLSKETPCGIKLPFGHSYSLIGTLKGNSQGMNSMSILPNTYTLYENNVTKLFDLGKPKLGGEERLFLILRNPHGREGVITLLENDDWGYKVINKNDGVCIIDVEFYIQYFSKDLARSSNH